MTRGRQDVVGTRGRSGRLPIMVAAIDVQYREQNDWHPDVSVRAGVQLEKLPLFDRRIQLLVEYFSGYSPNGQFFRKRIESIGVGLHLYLY